MKKISIAIRDFALPVPRTGSIELHSGYGPAPMTGQHAHMIAQAMRAEEHSNYRAEVWTSQTFTVGEYQFTINGRMDGVFDGGHTKIEEIKTAFNIEELKKKLITNPNHPYCLQLKTYGYFQYMQTRIVPELTFHLASMRNRKTLDVPITLDIEEYEIWLQLRLAELVEEAKVMEASTKRRKKISKAIAFPFERPRPQQMDLLQAVADSVRTDVPLLVQAPTGLGKTAAVVYPVLREALSRGEKLIYVTPKNSQHSVAEETIKLFQDQGHHIKSLTLRAKAKLCFKAEPICNPEFCEYAKDHYQKVHENGLTDKLAKKKKVTYRSLRRLAESYQVCPFELQMELVERADAVICDYNYVFSPRSSLARFSPEGRSKTKRPNLVIDEAHNLPSRATSYYSPQLSSFVFALLKPGMERLPNPFSQQGRRLIDQCLLIIDSHRPVGCTTSAKIDLNVAAFMDHEAQINEFLTSYLESDVVIEPQDPVLKLANTWSNFVEALQFEGDNFFTTYTYYANGGTLKITCCDASDMLKENYAFFAHIVGFSATLKPFEYYAKLSGLDVSRTKMSEFKSPFPKENRKLLLIPQVSTRYSVRHANYAKIADGISRITAIKPGNYFVFFPSFDFLEHVAGRVKVPGFRIVKQTREMKNAAVEDVIDQLKRGGEPILLFAVQGGVFSEGVDYPGDMAIGAIIVGPGLPTFDLERELLKQFYDKRYGEGFGYAYVYPAMTKVVQSAGRVIRSETDRGLIVLMDNRFLTKPYAEAMPADWFVSSAHELVSREILKDIQNFWSGEQASFHFDATGVDSFQQARAQEVGEEPQFSPEETSQ